MAEGQLTAGHARALLGTPDRAFQEALAQRIVAEGLSVREAGGGGPPPQRGRGAGVEATAPAPAPAARAPAGCGPPGLLELEELLAEHLDTRVKVAMAGADGRARSSSSSPASRTSSGSTGR